MFTDPPVSVDTDALNPAPRSPTGGVSPPLTADDCQRCGACCAHFRVSFYWAEALEQGLADAHYEPIGRWFVCMAGTNQPQPRCEALSGTVGEQVACTLYDQRPSPCRELQPGDAGCLRARARHGLGAPPQPLPVIGAPGVPADGTEGPDLPGQPDPVAPVPRRAA